MAIIIAVAGAITAALAAVGLLWARARRLQQELSELRVQRAFEWVITGRAPQDLAVPTPEQRRAAFYIIRGGSAAAASLLSARLVAGLRQAREHPALTTASLTALTAACVILVLAAVHSSPNSHAAPTRPPASTTRLSPSPSPRPSNRTPASPTPTAPTPTAPTAPTGSSTWTPPTWLLPERPPTSVSPAPGMHITPPAGPSTTPPSGATPSPSAPDTGAPAPTPPAAVDRCLLDLQAGRVLEVDVCAPVRSAP
jgi:hypothetical protein